MRLYSRPLISEAQHCVVKRKMMSRHPVVLKEIGNRADTKVNVTVEPEFILSQR